MAHFSPSAPTHPQPRGSTLLAALSLLIASCGLSLGLASGWSDRDTQRRLRELEAELHSQQILRQEQELEARRLLEGWEAALQTVRERDPELADSLALALAILRREEKPREGPKGFREWEAPRQKAAAPGDVLPGERVL